MISVILPTKDEPFVSRLTKKIHDELRRRKHEIIVIDASKRKPVIKDAKVFKQKTKGLGNAIVEGIKKSKGDIIVVMDADFSHDPSEMKSLLDKISAGYDFVMGSRYCQDAKSYDSGVRYGFIPNIFISRLYCMLASLVLGIKIKDPMNGYAAARREVYDSIKLNPRGYKIHMETIYKAKKLGFKITEVPTTFRNRLAGKSNTNILEAIRTLRFIFELRLGLR